MNSSAIASVALLVAVVGAASYAAACSSGNSAGTVGHPSSPTIDLRSASQAVTSDDLADSGRLLFYVIADAVPVDDSGNIVPDSFRAVYQSCEADALVQLADGRVSSVSRQGTTTDLGVGDEVVGDISSGEHKVYRDNNGNLRLGCDPDSWTVINTDSGSESGIAP